MQRGERLLTDRARRQGQYIKPKQDNAAD